MGISMDIEARQAIEQQSRRMNKLAQALSEAAKKQHEADLSAKQQEIKDTLIEIQAKLYDRAAAYTNLVLFGGYAGSFAIWAATRAQLPPKANVLIAFALGVSLAAFVFFEVYKATYTAIRFLRNRTLIFSPDQPQIFLDKIQKHAKEEQRLSVLYIPIWIVVMIVTIGAALVALCLLFYNYFAIMVGWPGWPK